jgi:outer membrane receptor for ferrienterochelin and colicins
MKKSELKILAAFALMSILTAQEETIDMPAMFVQDSVILSTKLEDKYAVVDTVARAEIEKTTASNLLDLLDGKLGVRKKVDCSVCNTAHIRLLGLNSAYSQILINGVPAYSGLGNVYGIEQIPLVNIDNVLIIKGASSVRHGNNAVAGVVDIIHKPIPFDTKTYLKMMFGHHNEQNYDAYFSTYAEKTKTGVQVSMAYANSPRIDMDNSTPMIDVAEFDRVNFSTRLSQEVKNTEFFANAQVGYEDRFGGTQSSSRKWVGSFQPESVYVNEWGDSVFVPLIYQEYAKTKRVNYEIGAKTQISPIVVNESRISFIQHFQDSYYGYLSLKALQNYLFAVSDFHFDFYRNKLLAGASFTYDKFYDDRSIGSHLYTIPALYLQNIFVINDEFLDLSVGMRGDFHNVHGFILSPRFALNYYANHHLNFKATAGKGFRTFNLFSENHSATTSDVYYLQPTDNLRQESSWTFALNAQYSQFWRLDWGITAEATAYQTMISDYIQVNYLRQYTNDGRQIVRYENLDGTAITRGIEGAVRFSLPKGFAVESGANLFHFNAQKGNTDKNFAYYSPNYTALAKIEWNERKSGVGLSFDYNYTGRQLLREVRFGKKEIMPQRYSRPYSIFNAQIDKKFSRWTLTFACQNIGNFYQSKIEPVFYSDGWYYLTTSVWAPMKGRTFYGGIRFN